MKNFRIAFRKIKVDKTSKYLLVIFVLFLIGSILYSPIPLLGVYMLIKIIEFLFLGFVILINRNKFIEFMRYILPISVIFESLLGITQFINKGSINGIFYFFGERSFTSQTPGIANASVNGELILRPYATFSHPNVLAAFLVLSMTFLLFIISYKKNKTNYLIFSSFAVGIIALILTFSRTAIIVFVLSLFLVLVRNYLKGRSIKIYLIGMIAIIVGIIFSLDKYRFLISLSDSSIVDRKDLILASFKMIKNYPLFGVGLNNFLPQLPKYYYGSGQVFFLQPVHNVPLLIITQVGVISFLIIAYFMLILFRNTNFEGKIIILELFILSFFDHYFLTIQQGQILLTVSICMAIMIKINDRIKANA